MAKRYSQPQGGAQIDWANPITTGLVVAINPAESVSSGIPKGSSGTIVYAATTKGFGARFSDATAAYLSYASDGLKPASGAPYTLLCLYRLNSIPSSSARIVSSFASNTYGYTIAPNNVNFRAIIAGGGVNTVFTGSAVAVKDKADVLSFDGTSGRYYEGGRLAAGPTAATSNLSVRDFFLGSDSVGSNSAPVTITLTAFWNRALADAEIKSISDNPWQLFQPTNRAIYPVAAGGGAGNATGSLASITIDAATGTATGKATATATPANVSITAPTATATGGAVGNATGALSSVTLAGPSATASGKGQATTTPASVTLVSPTATATGKGQATGALAAVSLVAPTGTASASAGGTGNAVASPASINIAPPGATATGAAAAFASFMSVVLTPVSGTASSGVIQVAGAITRDRRTQESSRPHSVSTSRPSRIANTTR